MNTLIIRHVTDSNPSQFLISRPDGKSTDPVAVPSPIGFPVQGRPNSDLVRELRWYLEQFLDYPFEPETDHAERVLDALRDWGRQAFDALFDNRAAAVMFDAATRDGYQSLLLQVWSDDPRILSWPWEALRDTQTGLLAQTCQIERRLNRIHDPAPVSRELPGDRINILLITARPYEGDVQYRSISRPLVELIEKENIPAAVHVLRPPTLDNLRSHLQQRPHTYHILHFDGHGAYGTRASQHGGPFTLQGPEGFLVFEDDSGGPAPVSAEQLSVLLREYGVPAAVLNACQSAMIDQHAQDPFASVAASLLQSGIRSVVAMAWSLYVSGAQEFLPAFYRCLFQTGSATKALRAGRQQMFANQGRVCARGRFPLHDWLVPVLYQQDVLDLSFVQKPDKPAEHSKPVLAQEFSDQENPYGFIGRDGELLKLERAMRRDTPAILIQGLGGVGKTTLARGFVEWLGATGGLGQACFWFSFNEIRSAEYVFNRMGEALFGPQFAAEDMDRKIEALAQCLRHAPCLIVWDNFEVVAGIPGSIVKATLSEADRSLLLRFLKKVRGGKSKVVITSRSEEPWLGIERMKVSIGGLRGEEKWEYCERILGDLGLNIRREDKDLATLMALLDGHPLAMRVILPRLENQTPGQVVMALKANLAGTDFKGDEASSKLYATLKFVQDGLEPGLQPLLVPLAFHERYVNADYLEYMAKAVDSKLTRARIDACLTALAAAGLLRNIGQNVFEMHPALTGFLRSSILEAKPGENHEAWRRAFVNLMGSLADALAPRPLHEQRAAFHLHSANFYFALSQARLFRMHTATGALTQSLAAYAHNTRNFSEARDLLQQLVESQKASGNKEAEAAAYHRLGVIGQAQRDFDAAEKWYRKSLEIKEKQGYENRAASTYHQLGMIALEQKDFGAATKWHLKSLAIKEKHGNEHGAAMTYHQLGRIAEEQRDFHAAERWYRKSLAIKEKHGDEHGAASTYHQLAIIAEEQRDFHAAERWYRKSLAIKERQGNEHGAASTYHQLGMIAQAQRDFGAAEEWYRKSLAITERLGIEEYAAGTYHQLGRTSEEQRDFGAAEKWYRKSLAISEKLGIAHGVAKNYGQLSTIAQKQGGLNAAEKWYRKSLVIDEKQGNEHSAASTYGQLGILAGMQGNFVESGQWLVKCIRAFASTNDSAGMERNVHNFLVFYRKTPSSDKRKLEQMWKEAGLGAFPEMSRM